MKTFVVSDLHGQGKVYDSMINYLNNIDDDVKLYIVGDLIDRGDDSIRMLMDVIHRNNIDITLLAGNHELFLYQYLNTPLFDKSWFLCSNGGEKTMRDLSKLNRDDMFYVKDYIDNLPISVKLDGIGKYDNIYLGHAKICENTDLKLKDYSDLRYDYTIFNSLWSRDSDVGIKNSLNIIGHTPVCLYGNKMYKLDNNILNIDGGCAFMNLDSKELVSPLIEIDYNNNLLNIIGFNKKGELTDVDTLDFSINKNKSYCKK